jgi:hypothetical protein
LAGGTALAAATDMPVKPAAAVSKPARTVEPAPTPLPRARPAAMRMPASVVWMRPRAPLVRFVSAAPRPFWSYYAIVHGVGF